MISIELVQKPIAVAALALVLPMATGRVRAGFPSPNDDFTVKRIDLTEVLITHPQATFLLRVSGTSVQDAGIFDGDMLAVDKAIKPRHRHIVVAVVDGEFTVKYLHQRVGRTWLRAANPSGQSQQKFNQTQALAQGQAEQALGPHVELDGDIGERGLRHPLAARTALPLHDLIKQDRQCHWAFE